MKKYHVTLTWGSHYYSETVLALSMDEAIALAKLNAGAPERASSQTQRVS